MITDIQTEHGIEDLYRRAARLNRFGVGFLRMAVIIVLFWIGGLKFANYEADGIVPLISNSPLMSFFYRHPAPEYRPYMNKEGELNLAHRRWHETNGTYSFSHGLGSAIIIIGILIALHPLLPQVAAVGSLTAHRHGLHDPVVPGHHTGGLGAGVRRLSARLSLLVWRGTADYKGRDHAWRGDRHHG